MEHSLQWGGLVSHKVELPLTSLAGAYWALSLPFCILKEFFQGPILPLKEQVPI